MAIVRQQPTCPHCGEAIKGIYNTYSDLPAMMRPIGDNFIKWDWSGHDKICEHHPLKVKTRKEAVINMNSTIVKMTCVSKKEQKSYDAEHPIRTTIELEVPYDQNSIYHKMSGGTNIELHTVNQSAADMFVLGGEYDMVISPAKKD